ncbi:hypothetical protein ACHAW5_000786 [Stephanodiscus triporus]|uniref:Mitochondrial carrier protein n=1 Tax=Stephanodiscus triporus TaxID=2934178 RepID=A0ABD3MX62_9STRA
MMLQSVLLFLAVHVQLIDGFSVGSVHNVIALTKTKNEACQRLSGPTINEVVRLPLPTLESADEVQRQLDGMGGGVDRRAFFVTMVCAASILTVYEDANADTMINPSQDPMNHELISDISTTTALAYSDAILPEVIAPPSINTIVESAAKKALGGGKAGAAAAVVQVLSLMWLRTTMNYQYRFGGTLSSSLKELYEDGGIPRLYQGLPFALVQGPLTRFGDTAANVGVLALLESIPETASLPIPIKTAAGSVSAGLWRIFLMPIDTSKTVMQVEGSDGLERLRERVLESGPAPLYQGAIASAAATAAGHYPWFTTYNFLNDKLPTITKEDDILLFLVRSAVLGLSASCVSDIVSNSLRVIKTTKQTAGLGDNGKKEISYKEALALVIENDGVLGLFGRGLQTRLLTNAIQGALFSVLWKYFQVTI